MQRQRHVAVWLRMLAQMEIRSTRSAKAILKKQGTLIEYAYANSGQSAAEQFVNEGQTDWLKFLVAHYSIVVKEFVTYTNEQLGLKPKKASFLDILQGFIAREAYKKSKYLTQTTHEIVKRAVSNGVVNGLGEKEIAKNLKQEFIGGLGNIRARTIARTETHNAATYGMQSAAEETDRPLIREWVAVEDERTRPAHAEADGQQVDMDQPFEVDGELIDRPGEGSPENSINCRCTVIYINKEGETTGDDSGDFI
jgi:SPP1 gp7 family putative phage head morphogenesis protein